MKYKHSNAIMIEEKQIGDCSILVAIYLAIKKAILMSTQKNLQINISKSDSAYG